MITLLALTAVASALVPRQLVFLPDRIICEWFWEGIINHPLVGGGEGCTCVRMLYPR